MSYGSASKGKHAALRRQEKAEIAAKSARRVRVLSWAGLALMGVQFGVFWRLTWWEYSWDIMEPVTYFATYAGLMAMYAYFVLTDQASARNCAPRKSLARRVACALQQYEYPQARDRLLLTDFHRKSRARKFDVERYNEIKRQIAQLESELRRLKRPDLSAVNLPVTSAQ